MTNNPREQAMTATTERRRSKRMPIITAADFKDAIPSTKNGTPKKKFTWDEKLRMLAPKLSPKKTHRLLLALKTLLAPKAHTQWIYRRVTFPRRQWKTVDGQLPVTPFIWHLLGNRIATRPAMWVGIRTASSYVSVIDVDYDFKPEGETKHPTREEIEAKRSFNERCQQVEAALQSIGIDPADRDQVLVVKTPRGGRHYVLVFDNANSVCVYHGLWNRLGLYHDSGKIELYPRREKGIRLPFGHGHGFEPDAWIRFTLRYLKGKVRRFKASELLERAEQLPRYRAVKPIPAPQPPPSASPSPTRSTSPLLIGVPKHRRRAHDLDAAREHELRQWYRRVVNEGPQNGAEVERLLQIGILEDGTRTQVLMILAEHLVWFRGLSVEDAADTLTEWAMNSRHNSKDIRSDLQGQTDEVRSHILSMCRWCECTDRSHELRKPNHPVFGHLELGRIMSAVQRLPRKQWKNQAHFFLQMLAFMKSNGRRSHDGKGWEAHIAAESVMRKTWKGCSGKRYKVRVEAAKASGLLTLGAPPIRTLTKTGRPQEYKLIAPFVKRTDCTLDYAQALKFLLTPIIEMPKPPRKRSRRPLHLTVSASNEFAAEQALAIAEDADEELWPTTTPATKHVPCETVHHEQPQPAEQPNVSNKHAPVVEEMPPIPEQQLSTASQPELPVSIPARPRPLTDLAGAVNDFSLQYGEENRAIERELMDNPDTPAAIREMLAADRMTMPQEHFQLVMWAVQNERRRRRGEQPRPVPKNLEDLLGNRR